MHLCRVELTLQMGIIDSIEGSEQARARHILCQSKTTHLGICSIVLATAPPAKKGI